MFTQSRLIITLLRIACVCLFLGRAWQHLRWDAPFRRLLWDQSLLQGFVEGLFGISWHTYVTSSLGDTLIQSVIQVHGGLYVLCALAALFAGDKKRVWNILLLVGAVSLGFLSFLYYMEHFFRIGMFIEHTAQICAPVLLYLLITKSADSTRVILITKSAIALTFAGHGLYALGYYPVPGEFVSMTMEILSLSENSARIFLFCVGCIDIVVAIGLFVPRIDIFFLGYAFVWGGLTAMARVVAFIDTSFMIYSLDGWLFQTLFRVPHSLVPLACIFMISPANMRPLIDRFLSKHFSRLGTISPM